MHPEEAEEHLAVIRSTMERTTRYTGIPSVSCFLAGALALAGCVASGSMHLDFNVPRCDARADGHLAWLWGGVCALAMAQFVALSSLARRRQGQPLWSGLTQRVVQAVLPGILVAALLTWHFAWHLQFDVLPPVWCLCYAASLLGLGLYAGWKANVVGALFMVAGAAGLFAFRTRGLELMAASFGGLHVLLGLLLPIGHERRSED